MNASDLTNKGFLEWWLSLPPRDRVGLLTTANEKEIFPLLRRAYEAGSHARHGSKAAIDVLAERERQLTEIALEDDDQWMCEELAALACLYAMPPAAREWDATSSGYGETLREAILPPDWRFTPGNRRDELRKAGGLILAEMERIDGAAIADQVKEPTCS